MRAGGLLVCLPVPLLEERARSTEPWAETLTTWRRTGCLSRTETSSIPLHASLATAANSEGSARTAEAIERALPPGDVADATENHQSPGEVGTALVMADGFRLAALDQGVPVAVIVRIVD